MKFLVRLNILMLVVLVFALPGLASNLDWKVYESEHFVIFYQQGYEYQAQETAYFLEQALPRVQKITGNDRKLKTRIIIQDTGINSNGNANQVTHKIGVFTNTPTDGTLAALQNWYRLVGGHELTHMYQLLNYSGAGAVVPTIMGDFFSPNSHVPLWIIEGITVYYESQITPYEGRLNDGYYDAVVRAKAQAGKFPSILEANYPHHHFPTGNWYVYGGTFMRYLVETYGEEKITEFFNTNGRNFFGFLGGFSPDISVDRSARKVFGKSFAELFKDWEAVEVARNRDWRIDGERVTAEFRGWVDDLMVSADGKLYYFKGKLQSSFPDELNRALFLAKYDPLTGRETELFQLASGVLAKPQIVNNKLYYLCREEKNGYPNLAELGLGSSGILYSYDLATGKNTKIVSDDMKAFMVINGEIVYAKDRKDAFGTEIWKYTGKEKVLLGTIEQTVAEFALYNGRPLMVSKARFGGWNINFIDISTLTMEPVVNTAWSEVSMSIKGDQLYYSANYNHEWGIYVYDFLTHEVAKLTEGGYSFDGVPVGGDLYFKGLTGEGEAVFKKPITPLPYELSETEVVRPEPVSEFAATLQEKNAFLTNLSYLFPDTRIPFSFSGSDGLGTMNYLVEFSQNGVSINMDTQFLQPLVVNLRNYPTDTGRGTTLSANYPLYISSQYGLSNVSVSAVVNSSRWAAGSLMASYRFPAQLISTSIFGTLDKAVVAELGYLRLLDNGSLSLRGGVYTNYAPGFSFRGMTVSGNERETGMLLSANLTHKLTEVRKGFWPSTLFLGDLYGGLFADYATHDGGMVSGGANIQFELGMGYQMVVTPEIGLAVNNQGGVKPYFSFGMSY